MTTASAQFAHPRLAAVYDPLDPDRSDLDVYTSFIEKVGARRVLDVGCGTGVLACTLAERGIEVVGVDPAAASLGVAREKPFAETVCWIHGDATTVGEIGADVATMTANVAMVFTADTDLAATLRAIHRSLDDRGRLVFEAREPRAQPFLGWNRDDTWSRTEVPGHGEVESWCETQGVDGSLLTFQWTFVFHSDGEVLTSTSTLRFREREEIAALVEEAGFGAPAVSGLPVAPERAFLVTAQKG